MVVVTGHGDQNNAVKAVGLGAYDFYQKPVDVDTLQLIVQRAYRIHGLEAENRRLLEALGTSPLDGVIAASDAMLKVCRTIEKVAPTNATTLLQGESGTGKEVFARAIHSLSPRAQQPFVAINCAAIPETLLESELFGSRERRVHGRDQADAGQDRGRRRRHAVPRRGRRHAAVAAGEAAALPARTRGRARRRARRDSRRRARGVRDEQESAPGDCDECVSRRSVLPDQRDHDRDSAASASAKAAESCSRKYLLNKFSKQQGRAIKGFSEDAHDAIETYAWPGNVREMENKIKAGVIMAESKFVTAEDLGLAVSRSRRRA